MTPRTDQSQHFLIPAAANAEAERLGHAVVDTDHLLLGLMSAGGPAAEAATQRGLRLTDFRAAMAQLQREDLLPLLDTAGGPPSTAHPSAQPAHAGESLPWAPRATTALRENSTQLLEHLAVTPGPARRLLEHVGVDLTGVDLDAARTNGDSPTAGSTDDSHRGTTARAVVAVEAATLLAVAADETRLSSWFGDYTVRGKTLGAGTVRLDLVDDHGAKTTLLIQVRTEGSGSEVQLTLHDAADTTDASLIRRLFRWLKTSHLRASITSLASAAA